MTWGVQSQRKAHELNVFIFASDEGEVVDLMVHTSCITVVWVLLAQKLVL